MALKMLQIHFILVFGTIVEFHLTQENLTQANERDNAEQMTDKINFRKKCDYIDLRW